MKNNKLCAVVSGALAAVTVTLIVNFMLVPPAWAASTEKVLHSFTSNTDGSGSSFGLISDTGGNLYGARGQGGAYGWGTLFQLTPNPDSTWTFNVIHNFTGGEDGGNPGWGRLAMDATGNLYGTTYRGGTYGLGVVFKLTPNQDGSWTESTLYQFTGGDDGEGPETTPMFDNVGNLYATTTTSVLCYECGGVFKLAPNQDGSWTESTLYQFTGGDGGESWAGVIFDTAGNLYGTTRNGGAYGDGIIFILTPNQDGSWTESALHQFTGGNDGADPSIAGLSFDGAGNLYGATERGGRPGCDDGCGIAFEIAPDTKGRILHRFTGNRDGGHPNGLVSFDTAGGLYETAWYGGAHGFGVVVKATPLLKPHADYVGWQKSVIYSFKGGKDGASPSMGVIVDGAGNVYGTTTAGGSNGAGVVYEITP
jgi:uncharacterized repeat protein (TIGR03803 family)